MGHLGQSIRETDNLDNVNQLTVNNQNKINNCRSFSASFHRDLGSAVAIESGKRDPALTGVEVRTAALENVLCSGVPLLTGVDARTCAGDSGDEKAWIAKTFTEIMIFLEE